MRDVSFFILFGVLISSVCSASTLICDSLPGSPKLQVRVSFSLPFEEQFTASLEEDELQGGLAEKLPVLYSPTSEIGVGSYFAQGSPSYDTGILTVFNEIKPSSTHLKKDLRLPATYVKVLTSFPEASPPWGENSTVKLFMLLCRFKETL